MMEGFVKQLFCFVAVLIIIVAANPAEAANLTFYGGSGLGTVIKPGQFSSVVDIGFSDAYKSGVSFSGGIGYPLSPMFELVGRFSYSDFPFDEEGLVKTATEAFDEIGVSDVLEWTVTGDKMQVIEFVADIKMKIPVGGASGTFRPVLLGGLGLASIKIEEWSIWPTNVAWSGDLSFIGVYETIDTKFMFNVGGGFDWMATPRLGVFGDIRYTQVATGDPIGYVPVRVGLILKLK